LIIYPYFYTTIGNCYRVALIEASACITEVTRFSYNISSTISLKILIRQFRSLHTTWSIPTRNQWRSPGCN